MLAKSLIRSDCRIYARIGYSILTVMSERDSDSDDETKKPRGI